MLLKNSNGTLSIIKESDFQNEKELQSLCENNLDLLLNLEFVSTEFSVANFRLDTLAYDKESKSFVIIEYKKSKNSSVIDQGYSYLSILHNHKADFVLEYSKKSNKVYSITDIDWAQCKILFISPHFTNYQTNSINFKNLPIELWKIKKFANNTISLDQIKPANPTASIDTLAPVKNEIISVAKNYSEEGLLSVANENINELYQSYKEFILNEDEEIATKVTKLYIGFTKNRHSLISIKIQKASLLIWLNASLNAINDPQGLVKDVTLIGHHGVGNCEIKVENDNNLGYFQDIIKGYLGR